MTDRVVHDRAARAAVIAAAGGLEAALATGALPRRVDLTLAEAVLLGLLRHLAKVEQIWFRITMAGSDIPRLYVSDDDPAGDFDGAVGDRDVVAEAWESWRREVAFAEEFVDKAESLDIISTHPTRDPIALRNLLVHMIEEYARHCGHADLLRERIDGRTGQ
jgi:hypothetical protein